MKVIFIAIPSKGTVKDGALTEEFLKTLAQLHLDYPECAFVAPMVQDYQLLKFMPQTDATWEVWGKHCQALIERSDEVWVLKFDGWKTSVGVQAEVLHAKQNGKTVRYFNVYELGEDDDQ